MAILSISDLRVASELDGNALSKIRGGFAPHLPGLGMQQMFGEHAKFFAQQPKFLFEAAQAQSQGQSVVTNNGNNAAFVAGGASPSGEPYSSVNTLKF